MFHCLFRIGQTAFLLSENRDDDKLGREPWRLILSINAHMSRLCNIVSKFPVRISLQSEQYQYRMQYLQNDVVPHFVGTCAKNTSLKADSPVLASLYFYGLWHTLWSMASTRRSRGESKSSGPTHPIRKHNENYP